jgi:hypothetical protein
MKKNNPTYAYVLMRNDLASLGAGKSCAHAHHAGTRMTYHVRKHGNRAQKAQLALWEEECEGVGTTIVLECDEETMKWCVAKLTDLKDQGVSAGVWHDPTYPSTTDRGFCLMPMDVCAWVLGPQEVLAPVLGSLLLMNNCSWARNTSDAF